MRKALFAFLPLLSACAGQPPDNIGIRDGRLTACPDSPNCVSSYATDETHSIPALAADLGQIQQVLATIDAANIVEVRDNYLYAEFTSRLMGYVDDVEFLHDASTGLTHVRSASRLGYGDLGANRKRIEAIRSALTAN